MCHAESEILWANWLNNESKGDSKCNANKTQNLERAIEKRRLERPKSRAMARRRTKPMLSGSTRREKINIWNHSSISACQKNVVKTSLYNLCFIITFLLLPFAGFGFTNRENVFEPVEFDGKKIIGLKLNLSQSSKTARARRKETENRVESRKEFLILFCMVNSIWYFIVLPRLQKPFVTLCILREERLMNGAERKWSLWCRTNSKRCRQILEILTTISLRENSNL